MKITGELLKSERIKLKLSQQDIGFALKLSPRTINAIEEGDIESLPAKTFVRGFVKSYAEMLKLDPVLVLSQFQEEMGTTRPISKVVSVPSENAKAKASYSLEENTSRPALSSVTPNLKMNLNKNTLKLVGIITLLVIVLGGINQIINKYQKEGSAPEAPKLTVETLTQEANANKDMMAAPMTTAPIEALTGPTDVTGSALIKPSDEPTRTTEVLADGKSVELVIEATKDTVISYSIGSENVYKTLELKKNTFQIIKSKSGLHLKTDEGNSISITVNGISKGLASPDAKPTQLNF